MSDTNRTDIKKTTLLKLLVTNEGNVSHACKAAHMGRRTYYDWLKEDKAFADAVDDIQEGLVDWGEGLLRDRMSKGDTTAIIFFLKTKGRSRGYIERQDVAHSGADGKSEFVLKVVHTGTNGTGGNGNGGGNGDNAK